MPFVHGRVASLWFGNKDISTYLKQINFGANAQASDTTTFQSQWKTSLAGLLDATVDTQGLYDPLLTDLPANLGVADTVLSVGPGGLLNVGDPARLINVQTTKYSESPPVGDVIGFAWAVIADGPASMGNCLLPFKQAYGAKANGYVTSTAMGNITYTQGVTQPTDGLPHNVTCTRAVVAGADTPGTVLVTGTDYLNQAQTEVLTPGADTVLVQGLKAFKTVTSLVGSGWSAVSTADNIVFGWGAVMSTAGVDNLAASTTGAIAHLHCSAVSASDTLTVTIEDSAVGVAGPWAAVASGAFTGLTTAGNQRLIIPGTIRRYVRATPTITAIGTSNATFGVTLART
jgi:hypothetical protein